MSCAPNALGKATYRVVAACLLATCGLLILPTGVAAQGVTVSTQTLNVQEGSSAQYTVVLNTLPTDVVYIDVLSGTGSDTDLLAPSMDRTDLLTFEVGKWNVPQTVKVSAAEDTDRPDRHRRLPARGFRDRPDAVSLDRRIRLWRWNRAGAGERRL